MKKKQIFLLYPIITIGLLFVIAVSCKKDNVPNSTNIVPHIEFNLDKIYDSIKDIEGNTYKTIQIGTQTWMAENLKTSKYNDGIQIPTVTESAAWAELTTPAYCTYNSNIAKYVSLFGKLYNWYAVNTGKLCPVGWHVPSDSEWHQMALFLDTNAILNENPGTSLSPFESKIAGGKLKEIGTSHWPEYLYVATNETGFTALPGGYRYFNGNFDLLNDSGFWWTATESSGTHSWDRYLTYYSLSIFRSIYPKQSGFSVRCIKD